MSDENLFVSYKNASKRRIFSKEEVADIYRKCMIEDPLELRDDYFLKIRQTTKNIYRASLENTKNNMIKQILNRDNEEITYHLFIDLCEQYAKKVNKIKELNLNRD